MHTLAAMNPFIKVTSKCLGGLSFSSVSTPAASAEQVMQLISDYDLIISTHGISQAAAADALEEAVAGGL